MKKILNIVRSPYRATQEEQDDSVLWLTHALQSAGGQMTVLLAGAAVNYAVTAQDPGGVTLGDMEIARPPLPHRDLVAMQEAGVSIYFLREDAAERGISMEKVEPDFEPISRAQVAALMAEHDQVWQW